MLASTTYPLLLSGRLYHSLLVEGPCWGPRLLRRSGVRGGLAQGGEVLMAVAAVPLAFRGCETGLLVFGGCDSGVRERGVLAGLPGLTACILLRLALVMAGEGEEGVGVGPAS